MPSLTISDKAEVQISNAKASHKLEVERGNSHSCLHMAPKYYIEAVPFDTRQESGRMGTDYLQCCTSLATVSGCSQKF